jgi:ectoine hydroxylase-related dioxygenase (phytanoyl-CoA dioxygenase family)
MVREGAEAVRRDGWLLMEDVVERDLIEEFHAAFSRRHASSGASGQPAGSLRVGHERYMVTLALKPPFTDPRLYSNPPLLGVLTELLGADRVLVSFGVVVSQPGAEDQHVHRDGGGLFGDPAIEASLPPYAITVIVPLVDMNAETGTTRVWPGSHRMTDEELHGVQPQDPVVKRGSVLLMDYRLHHGGLANRSAGPRPILSLVFARPWWRDDVNFREQPPLLYGPVQRLRMPPALRSLLPADGGVGIEQQAATIGRKLVARAPRRPAALARRLRRRAGM